MYNNHKYWFIFLCTIIMTNNIDQLKTEIDDIKKSLNELKNNVSLSDIEKKNQADALKTKAETTRQKIENEIKALETASDSASKKKKDEAEALLNSLTDITNLYNSIINPTAAPTSAPTSTPAQAAATEEKNIFGKAKDWIWDQWDAVWDKSKWERSAEWWKNLLRTAWFIATWAWAIALAYKWVKKLWNWAFSSDDEEDEDTEESESKSKSKKKKKEKKSFWDRWYWKALKWTGIGTWIYYVAHWLKTGRWSLEDFFNWADKNPDAISTTDDQVVWAEKLKEEDPEKFEKYRELWENIDSQYNQLMEKEINSWWWEMSIKDWYDHYCNTSLSEPEFKAIVPMCIDNQFSSVSDMLSEGGYYAYLRSKNFAALKDALLNMLKDWSDKLIWSILPFFWCLKSFEKYKDKDFLESVKTWLDDWSVTDREAELQLFFRQYAKVLNYVQDKRLALIEKIAKRKLDQMEEAWIDTSKYTTVNDAIKDKERFENNIEPDSEYKNFMEWKLTHAIDVMKTESIFDDKLSEGVEEIKWYVDFRRGEILNEKDWKDALTRLKENKEALRTEDYNEWLETSDKIYNDIEDYFDKTWSYMYFSSFHTLSNSDEKNRQEFLKESGLNIVKNNLKEKFIEFRKKFNDKTITSDEIDEYNSLVNSYFAMKKEVMVASTAIQTMKSDNASRIDRSLNTWAAILADLFNQSKKSWESFANWDYFEWWLYSTFPLLTAGWISRLIWTKNPTAKKLWKILLRINPVGAAPAIFEWAYKLTWNVARRTSNISKLNSEFLRHTRYNIEHGDELLFQDILEWRISWIDAENIARLWKDKREIGKWCRSLEEFMQKMSWEKFTLSEKEISDLFKTRVNIGGKDYDISFFKNEEIRKQIIWNPTWKSWKWKTLVNWYYRRYYDYSKMWDNAKSLWFWELFWRADWWTSKIASLSERQLTFLKSIVEDWNFTDAKKQLNSLFENIDKIDLKDISDENLVKIIEELWTNPTELEDLAKIQNRVNKFKTINISPERLRQPIFWEIDNVKHELEDLMKSETNAAKKTQIQQQINQLEDFKRELWAMPDDEFKRMNGLIECFKDTWTRKTLNEVITEVTKLKKIMDTNGWSLKIWEWIWPSGGQLRHIDQIIKDLDAESLRKAKKFHPEIETQLEDVAKIFEQIKLKNVSRVLWSADDILKGIKILVKLARAA